MTRAVQVLHLVADAPPPPELALDQPRYWISRSASRQTFEQHCQLAEAQSQPRLRCPLWDAQLFGDLSKCATPEVGEQHCFALLFGE